MLKISNKDDMNKMMNYHRTRDMIRLLKYFPEVSPIIDLCMVTSIEELKENYEMIIENFSALRTDNPITKPMMKSVEVAGMDTDLIEVFKKVKEIDSDGVLVFLKLNHEPSERYERYAGVAVDVRLGNDVCIEAVGRGFDGREVSAGLSCHERYCIPWYELRRCNIANFKEYRTFLISSDDYKKSRNNRIKFLTFVGVNEEVSLKNVPDEYREIPDFIWLDIIKNLVKRLENIEFDLKLDGLDEFVISGHTEGKKYRPWQLYTSDRIGTSIKK